jgi:hypothetical protein
MAGKQGPLDAAASRELTHHYLTLLERDLDACADFLGLATLPDPENAASRSSVREARETFAWRARRVVESALLARIHHAGFRIGESKSLHDLMQFVTKNDLCDNAFVQAHIESARIKANPAIHPQNPTTELDDLTIESLRAELVQILRWLQSEFDVDWGSRPVLQRALHDIAMRRCRPDRETEFIALQKYVRDMEREREGERAEQQRAQKRVARGGTRNAWLAVFLGLAAGTLTSFLALRTVNVRRPPSAPPAATLAAPPPATAAGRPDGDDASVRRTPTPADAATTLVFAGDSGDTPAPETPSPLHCDNGMVPVDARQFAIAQPVGGRRSWPSSAPGSETVALDVHAFCVDRKPVTPSDFERWRARAGRPSESRTCQRSPNSPAAACVSSDDASAFCEARGAALPSIEEWESIARAPRPRPPFSTPEWVEDLFPPEIFGRRSGCTDRSPSVDCGRHMVRRELFPEAAVPIARFSWNDAPHAPPGQDDVSYNPGDIGFRCVKRPSTSP